MKIFALGLLLLSNSSSGFESARVHRALPLATARLRAAAASGFPRRAASASAAIRRRDGVRLSAAPPSLSLNGALAVANSHLFPPSAPTAPRVLRLASLLAALLLCASAQLRRRLFWPNAGLPGATAANPAPGLLPGPLGCPFVGTPRIQMGGDEDFGAGDGYRRVARRLGRKLGAVPKIWKYYFLGAPFVVLSGGKTFQKVLNMEFGGSLTSSGADLMQGGLLPMESLLFERSKKRHNYLRRLVGAALTPAAVARTAPLLQLAVERQVEKMLKASEHGPIKIHQVCTDYTLDVLGLELTDEEVPVFEENVAVWIEGVVSLKVLLRIGVERSPGYAAREYIVRKIRERIGHLRANGPDGRTTLSGMVFATDDEDPARRLTDDEVVANALILIFAGSETAASTLTNAALFLGLHPTAWDRLAEEQTRLRERFGDGLDGSVLDERNAPYLDAVLKETLRMRVVSAGIPRKALEDIDVDGDGETVIPKGYMIDPSMMLTHEEDPNVKLPDGLHLDAIQGFRPGRWLGASGESRPDADCYVPYGSGPRYCLGRNLAQLEMKIFLATLARRIAFPRLAALPEGYDYSPDKRVPSDPDYFSVRWAKGRSVIPMAADGVMAYVRARAEPCRGNGLDHSLFPPNETAEPVFDGVAAAMPLGASNSTTRLIEA